MIHYRILNDGAPASSTVYRSLSSARKNATKLNAHVYAFSSRQAALNLAPERLRVSSGQGEPRFLSSQRIAQYINDCDEARAINTQYPPSSASSRRQMEARYTDELFGFDPLGRAVESQQYMSVSCRWVRFSAPVFINNKRSNRKGLSKCV